MGLPRGTDGPHGALLPSVPSSGAAGVAAKPPPLLEVWDPNDIEAPLVSGSCQLEYPSVPMAIPTKILNKA
ncbi:unnamed protein product [Linum trigynum]|uniref:Uncharacterized protein n=1 Tax=Linum trigynum TaxID=586398 RepID=A0AAV2E0T2_9ROSI